MAEWNFTQLLVAEHKGMKQLGRGRYRQQNDVTEGRRF
jgi:hypothetical protein